MNKKALSSVVATVLLILLTVMAIAILAGFIIPFVKNQLSKSTECLDFQQRYYFEEFTNCINPDGILLSVGARGEGNEEKVGGFDLILKKEVSSKVVQFRKGKTFSGLLMNNGTSEMIIPKAGEFYSYNYSTSEIYRSAELKAVLKSGRVCEMISDKIDLGAC